MRIAPSGARKGSMEDPTRALPVCGRDPFALYWMRVPWGASMCQPSTAVLILIVGPIPLGTERVSGSAPEDRRTMPNMAIKPADHGPPAPAKKDPVCACFTAACLRPTATRGPRGPVR